MILKFSTEPGSGTAVLCAKFQKRFWNWKGCYGQRKIREIWVLRCDSGGGGYRLSQQLPRLVLASRSLDQDGANAADDKIKKKLLVEWKRFILNGISITYYSATSTWWSINDSSGNDHYSDVIMSMMASQITGVLIVYSTVCSGAEENIKAPRHWNSPMADEFPAQRLVTRKMFPLDDVIMNEQDIFMLVTKIFSYAKLCVNNSVNNVFCPIYDVTIVSGHCGKSFKTFIHYILPPISPNSIVRIFVFEQPGHLSNYRIYGHVY